MTKDRRKLVRRQTDRDILRALETPSGEGVRTSVLKRKRRRAIRHTCRARMIQIQFEWNSARKAILGRVLDLSEGGASLFVKYPVAPDQIFHLEIELQDGKKIEVKAQVRWIKQRERLQGYTIGIEFTELNPAIREQIAAFLVNLDDTLGTAIDMDELE